VPVLGARPISPEVILLLNDMRKDFRWARTRLQTFPKRKRIPIALKMLITAIIAIVIQFALAIAGWGGWDAFFGHPALQALAWVTAVLLALSLFSGSSGLSTGVQEDRGNRWVLGAFSLIAMLITYFSSYTDRIGFWTLDGDTTRWFGVAVCAAGSVVRILPVFVLKSRFSGLVAIQAGHRLETRGLYKVIRNPSYLGMLLSSLGWALAFRAGVGMILSMTLLIPIIPRIHSEEKLLCAHFGAEYDAYCAHTWRLIPGIY